MVHKRSFGRISFVTILTRKQFRMRSPMHFQVIFNTEPQRAQITFVRFFRRMYPLDMLFQVIIPREFLLTKFALDQGIFLMDMTLMEFQVTTRKGFGTISAFL